LCVIKGCHPTSCTTRTDPWSLNEALHCSYDDWLQRPGISGGCIVKNGLSTPDPWSIGRVIPVKPWCTGKQLPLGFNPIDLGSVADIGVLVYPQGLSSYSLCHWSIVCGPSGVD
jgi:hypothetical protein